MIIDTFRYFSHTRNGKVFVRNVLQVFIINKDDSDMMMMIMVMMMIALYQPQKIRVDMTRHFLIPSFSMCASQSDVIFSFASSSVFYLSQT